MARPNSFPELIEFLEKEANRHLMGRYPYTSETDARHSLYRTLHGVAMLVSEFYAAEERKRREERDEMEKLRWNALAQLGQLFSDDFKERLEQVEKQLQGEGERDAKTEA